MMVAHHNMQVLNDIGGVGGIRLQLFASGYIGWLAQTMTIHMGGLAQTMIHWLVGSDDVVSGHVNWPWFAIHRAFPW